MAKVIRKKQTHWTRFLVVLLATWAMAASHAEAQFPIVETTAVSSDSTATTSHTVNLPSGIVSGDLLIVVFSLDNGQLNELDWPVGWTEMFDTISGTTYSAAVAYRRADGSEGTTITVDSTSIDRGGATAYRISGHHATTDPESADVAGDSITPDPPSLSPSWGAEDTLWIAGAGIDRPDITWPLVADPTSYTNGIEGTNGAGGDHWTRSLQRERNTATENPGTFTTSAIDEWIGFTIAVRPATSGASNPVAHWTLDEGTGDTAADPRNGNDGTLGNSPSPDANDPSWTCVAGGNALLFDGADDYVNVGDSASLNFGTGDFSVAVWVKSSQAQVFDSWPKLVEKWTNSPSSQGYRLMSYQSTDSPNPAFGIFSGGTGATVESTVNIRDGLWHHVVGVKTSTQLKIYIDGSLSGTPASHSLGTTSNSADLAFGKSLLFSGDEFEGNMDDVRIYNSALSAGEISTLYASPPTACGTILLVVPDAASLGAQDAVKKTLIESWGYTVVPISANDTQPNFDAAVATSNAVYVSKDITSGDLNTKLTSATIGVVNEEGALEVEFGFSSGKTNFTDSAIDITDNTHYITSPFSTGSLTITSPAQDLHYPSGTIASGVQVLAEQLATANGTLVVLDVGAALEPAGTAAGRRVFLPWGPDAFDINSLTADGQFLMRRAIEWATGAGSGPIAHWKFDEGGTSQTLADSSGNGYNATRGNDTGVAADDPAWTCVTGGNALTFDGTATWVNAGDIDAIDLAPKLTVTAWVKSADPTTAGRTLIRKNGSAPMWQIRQHTGGALRVSIGGQTPDGITTTTPVALNVWGHWAMVFDGAGATNDDRLKIYFNGTYQGALTFANGDIPTTMPDAGTAVVEIGKHDFFDGAIDDFRIYDRALTATEITALALSAPTDCAADSTAPTPDPMTFATAPDDASTTSISMIADTATDPSTPVKYLFTLDNTDCGADAGTGGDSSLWQTLTSYTDTGLQVNQCYGYTVTAQDSVPNTGTASSRSKAYTAANAPGTPVVSSPTSTSLTVDNAPNSNPAITTFAIAVDDDGDVSVFNVTKYVQADGTIGASAVWQTEATWGAQVVTGLSASTLYRFKVKARNGDNDETLFSAVATGTTSAAPSPDLQQLRYRWRNDDGGESGGPWYNPAWTYRKKITVDFTKVDANQTNFPVYVNLADLGADFFANVESAGGDDGGDIRVTQSDAITELPREVVSINVGTQTGELHFEANSLSSTVNTDFYIYYGNAAASEPAASALYGSQNVWANSYGGVWHLKEDQADIGNPDLYQDSTSNANHGDDEVSATGQEGQIPAGQEFDGSDDEVRFANAIIGDSAAFTITAWMKMGADTADKRTIYSEGQTSATSYLFLYVSDTGDVVQFYSEDAGAANFTSITGTTPVQDNQFHHIAMVQRSKTDRELFVNTGSQGTDTASAGTLTHNTASIGYLRTDWVADPFLGTIDEVRVATTDRTTSWIKTEFNNQDNPGTGAGGFLASIGSQETSSAGGATWAADEDTALTGLDKLTTKRVRIEISNEGTASSSSVLYRLEVSQANPTTCDDGGNTWTRIDTSTHWNMMASTHFADADPTTNIDPGLFDENTTFFAGEMKEDGAGIDDETLGITLSTSQFTEIEYAIQAAASATSGATYCFRLTDAGTATDFTYTETKYAKATLSNPSAAISSTNPASLTESNLNTSTVTVTLTSATYKASLVTGDFSLNGAPTGTTISGVVRDSATQATLTLDFNGTDFDTNASMSVTVATAGLVSGGPLTTGTVTVTAVIESPDLQQLHYRWRDDDGGGSGPGWYNPAWTYRKKITIDNAQVDANLTDFPVYVDLADLGADFFANVESSGGDDGGDIRVTTSNGTTELPREVVSINVGTLTGELHFEADFLSSTVNTDFYIYYGNAAASEPAASATYGSQNVWTEGYVGVFHLDETPTSGGTHSDSTSNSNDGTWSDTNALGNTNATGKVGGADDFDGTDDTINAGSGGSIDNLRDMTVSVWVEPRASIDVLPRIFEKRAAGAEVKNFYLVDSGELRFLHQTDLTTLSRSTTGALSLDVWSHVVLTWDGTLSASGVLFYVDGSLAAMVAGTNGTGTLDDEADGNLYIGNRHDEGRTFNGIIDEFRISNVVRTTQWISTEHNNQLNPGTGVGGFLATIGSQEAQWFDPAWSYRKKITIDNTKVDADQTDFPVYVDLADLGADFHSNLADANGGDIRVTDSDGLTELPRQVVVIDTGANTGELHFEANFLSSTVNTDFYIYYGNAAASEPAASSTYGSDEVWANNYVGVWHLHNDFLDSSFPNNNGTNSGSTNTGGKIGDGSDFLSSNTAGVDVLDSPTLDLNSTVTVSVWFNPNVVPPATSYQRLVVKSTPTNDVPYTMYGLLFDNDGNLRAEVASPGDVQNPIEGATLVQAGIWQYGTMTYDGNDLKLYWNGGSDSTPTTFSTSIDVNDEPLTMGKAGFDSQYFDGKLDEARVSSVARTAQWISTEYNNQDSPGVGGFLAGIDSQEASSGGGATWAADEDDPLTGLDKLTTKRVRIEISNEGTASSGSVLYRLEVSQANPTTCDAGGNTWTRVNSSADWNMALSTHFADADATQDINPGLTNENTTFVGGELKESTDEVNTGITLSTPEFTEIEYAVQATASATDSATYCFRLTDAGTATDFTYTETKYAKVTLSGLSAAITFTNPASLTESNLNTATVTVTLTDGTYNASLVTGDFSLNGAPTGTTISGVVRDSATQATLTLAFDLTDFDTNASMSVTVATTALVSGGPLTTGTVTVTAVVESSDLQQLHYRWRNDDGGEGVGAWYNSAWNYRKKITVDFTKVDANQNDFPVYVNLADLGANFFASVESAGGDDGGDIRVTNSDGITELPREIVTINVGTQTGELHFEADFLSSSVPTDFYIYYGNAAASEPLRSSIYGKDKVWENGYVGVWHLEESPANATAGHDDSTGNPNDGTPQNFGGAGSTTNATGKIGGADDLDGVDDYINVGSGALLDDLGPLTVSAWIKPDAYGASGAPSIATKRDLATTTGRWLFEIDNTAPEADSLAFAKDHVTTGLDVASDVSVVQIAPPAWQHVVATWDGSINVSGVHLYVNGGETLYGATQAAVGAPNSDAAWDLSFGAKTDGTNALHAGMDEIRLSSTPRLASWIKTEFNNQDNPGVGGFLAGIESQETHSADEDTPLTGLDKLTTKRVRIEISNEGTASSGSVLYRLEVSQANPTTCDAGGNTWTRIDTSTDWNMVAST